MRDSFGILSIVKIKREREKEREKRERERERRREKKEKERERRRGKKEKERERKETNDNYSKIYRWYIYNYRKICFLLFPHITCSNTFFKNIFWQYPQSLFLFTFFLSISLICLYCHDVFYSLSNF